jgi:hypothetical protein
MVFGFLAHAECFFKLGQKKVFGGCFWAHMYAYTCFLKKEEALNYMEGAYIIVFIRNGANLEHFFRQMPMRQK